VGIVSGDNYLSEIEQAKPSICERNSAVEESGDNNQQEKRVAECASAGIFNDIGRFYLRNGTENV
jgi:hypothetical protein